MVKSLSPPLAGDRSAAFFFANEQCGNLVLTAGGCISSTFESVMCPCNPLLKGGYHVREDINRKKKLFRVVPESPYPAPPSPDHHTFLSDALKMGLELSLRNSIKDTLLVSQSLSSRGIAL